MKTPNISLPPPVRFTLIELLVTIGVIAILAGMIFPAFAKARATAKRASCASNLHGIGTAFKMYLGDYKDYLPPAAMMRSVTPDSPVITDMLEGYIPSSKIMLCPSDVSDSYFNNEGTSYEYYNISLLGEPLHFTPPVVQAGESKISIMYDFEPFHGKKGNSGSRNYLFLDGHVGDN